MLPHPRLLAVTVIACAAILGGISPLGCQHTDGQSVDGLIARRSQAIRVLQQRGLLTVQLREQLQSAKSVSAVQQLLEKAQAQSLVNVPLKADRCAAWLQRICDLGSRTSNSVGMKKQQQLLKDHFSRLGGKVQLQEFDVRHPQDGSRVTMANMIVQWHPQRKNRILLCAHYDTRPYPDRDPKNPRGLFLGANDGASGTALLAELAELMPTYKGSLGIDFVLFDGEEFVFQVDGGEYFLGSTYFSRNYKSEPPGYSYKWGVLLDMVADRELELYYEVNSLRYARQLVLDIWKTAARLGVKEFRPRSRHEVRDDHIPLNQIAGIPSCDLIDFDYPGVGRKTSYWHTQQDKPENCSGVSMARVGWVVWEWMNNAK